MTNATSITAPRTRTLPGLDRLAVALLLGFVASLQVSIALAHALLAAMLVAWVAMLVRDRVRPAAPSFFTPLLAYSGITLVASAFSIDPLTSVGDSKQLLLFAIVPAVYDLARGPRAATVVDVIVTVGAASAAVGIIQYGMLHYDSLRLRPQGALTHYMTYSGVLMLVICAATARLVFGSRDRVWPALVMPALVVALALTLSRNAWVGACVAVGLLLVLKDFRLSALLPAIVAVLFAMAPDGITSRMMSMFDVQDPSNQDRLAMVEVGTRIIASDPLTGVGPNMVPRVYETYRPEYAINPVNPHLHNVPLQIAAERGLPALAIWGWFVVSALMLLFRLFRQGHEPVLAATALAAVAAMLAAGLFEYNFGDSEFLMLLLVLITLPFAATRADAAAPLGPDRGRRIVSSFSGAHILVVGDAMLDRFVVGRVTRISPEAPVPVVTFDHETHRIGGAANVAHNVKALGGEATLIAVTGQDDTAATLARACHEAGIAPSFIGDAARPTTTKVRIVTERKHQVARIDYETDAEISRTIEDRVVTAVRQQAAHASGLVISDYLKGSITRHIVQAAIAAAAEGGVPVLVDPKIPHLEYYAGADIVTPNHHEAETATGLRVRTDDEARAAARVFRERAGCGAVLMTRGDQGMWLLANDVEGQLPAAAREVADVTGAGDTVIAALALALAAGATLAEAARLANEAAGISVGKFGPATVSPIELLVALGAAANI